MSTSYASYGAKGGDSDGGFVYGGSQPGSQGAQGGQKNYSEDSLRPVTIKQLYEPEETYPGANDFSLDGHPVTQVTFVGQVRQVSPQSTNITYRIDDGTGTIEVKKWVDADKPEELEPKYQVDQYVRVWGRLKPFGNKRHIGAHFLRAVDDPDEIHYHLLEATYVHLYMTKGDLSAGGAAANGDGNAGNGDSMFVDSYGANGGDENAAKLGACGPAAKKMYKFLTETPGSNEGVHLNLITSGVGMTGREVFAAADELLGQGLIYTTVDDETWAVLDY
ncbi:hypothetical protein KVR01_002259 [Diaporthe batatas]|uniref:uncharacterized protein n=1 Tax=Diaporthe batatas TaxID=748121 RepID=UPI001D04E70D|nr:uncharacterized protein KVR01_002259 [Diaporthe batatas]KAG8166570.1 hypothetical protein KVR01_002259 [Diaporthe batatas]